MPITSFTRQCDRCGDAYTAQRRTSRYCSVTCRSQVSRERAELAPEPPPEPEPAPAPEPAPEPVDLVIGAVRECDAGDCYNTYTVARLNHRFCSNNCNRRAWRKRQRAGAP